MSPYPVKLLAIRFAVHASTVRRWLRSGWTPPAAPTPAGQVPAKLAGLVSVAWVAQATGKHPSTIRRWIAHNSIKPVVTAGGHYRFRKFDLFDFSRPVYDHKPGKPTKGSPMMSE
jgi:excisionase family DNA binding protein